MRLLSIVCGLCFTLTGTTLALDSPRTDLATQTPPSGVTMPLLFGNTSKHSGPLLLTEATFGLQNLFLGGTVVNTKDQTVIAYKIGWIYQPTHQRPQIEEGPWMAVPAGIASGSSYSVSAQNVPLALLKTGTKEIGFFVAEAKYANGRKWRAAPAHVRDAFYGSMQHQAPSPKQ